LGGKKQAVIFVTGKLNRKYAPFAEADSWHTTQAQTIG
jgi:hypothetical protein